jgi:peptidoglycan hydrolase-like protein with peptidoglycan-binding domain
MADTQGRRVVREENLSGGAPIGGAPARARAPGARVPPGAGRGCSPSPATRARSRRQGSAGPAAWSPWLLCLLIAAAAPGPSGSFPGLDLIPAAAARQADVADAQQRLHRLGYNPGPADGRMGPRTRLAIQRYQADRGLPVDGRTSPGLLERLRAETGGAWGLRSDPAVVLAPVTLREAPDPRAPSVLLLAAGARVEVEELAGSWARLRTGTEARGWVPAETLRLGAPPEITVAATTGASPAGWLRRLTGTIGGGRRGQTQSGVSIGIRGLAPDDLRNARPDPAQLRELEHYTVLPSAAENHASALGLQPRAVAYMGPARTPGRPSTGSAGSTGRE